MAVHCITQVLSFKAATSSGTKREGEVGWGFHLLSQKPFRAYRTATSWQEVCKIPAHPRVSHPQSLSQY